MDRSTRVALDQGDVAVPAATGNGDEPMTMTPTGPSTETATAPRWFVPLLLTDGIGSIAIGVGLLAAAGWLAGPLGLGSSLPVVLVGALFVINGPVNLRAARVPTRRSLSGPIWIDGLFGLAMLAVAVVDPGGAASWARWTIAAVAVMSWGLAVTKAWGRAGRRR